jgi:tRNA U34 5-carboxymethylaminomethyl modifying GTPase MnmE/TrmE
MNRQDETIFALATPAGRAAVQIIRISGSGAARALQAPGWPLATAACDDVFHYHRS